MEIKNKIEAILFASGRKMELEELSRLVKKDQNEVSKVLNVLKEDYEKRETPLMLIEEDGSYKINVKEDFLPLVSKIVQETELSKTMMETLAIVAYKAPVRQCEVINIRTNKAYDHLSELEKSGYISRTKDGRTKLIKLTEKFFGYFDIPPDILKKKFEKFAKTEKEIKEKENEAIEKIEEFKKKEEELRKRKEEEEKNLKVLENGIDLDERDSSEENNEESPDESKVENDATS